MQRDAAGLIVFDDEVRNFVPPSTRQGQLARLLHAVEKAEVGNRTDYEKPFSHVREFLHRRGLIAVISDFWEPPENVVKTIAPLRFHGNEVVLFHVLDPEEIRPKFRDPALLEDLESGATLEVSPEYAAKEYPAKIDAHLEEIRSQSQRRGPGLFPDRHQPSARCGAARVSGDSQRADVMGFFTPWFLAGAVAVGLPIWLHLLKRHKTDPKLFPSLMFFEYRETSSVKHRRLDHILLFVLRTLMILLLALLFASPFIRRSAAASDGKKLTVVAIDRSFSMRDGDRLARAKNQAMQVLGNLKPGDQAQVIALAGQVQALDSSHQRSRRAARRRRSRPARR